MTPFLPPKYEYVISIKLSDIQIKMYQYYLDHLAKGAGLHGKSDTSALFRDFQVNFVCKMHLIYYEAICI